VSPAGRRRRGGVGSQGERGGHRPHHRHGRICRYCTYVCNTVTGASKHTFLLVKCCYSDSIPRRPSPSARPMSASLPLGPHETARRSFTGLPAAPSFRVGARTSGKTTTLVRSQEARGSGRRRTVASPLFVNAVTTWEPTEPTRKLRSFPPETTPPPAAAPPPAAPAAAHPLGTVAQQVAGVGRALGELAR